MVLHRHKWFWPKVSMKKNIHGWMFIKIKDSGQGSAMIKYDTKHTEGPDLVRNPVIWLITIIRAANLHIMVEYIVNFILENQNVLHLSWRLVISVANHVPKGCSDVFITLSCAKVSWQIPTIHKLMPNKLWFQIVYLISLHYVWLRKLVLTQNRPVFFCARKTNNIVSNRKMFFLESDCLWQVILQNTVKCHYNTVQYCTILHEWLQELRQNINQMLDSQKTPHTSP